MLLFSYKTPPVEKVLLQTPDKENITVEDLFKQQAKPTAPSVLALISDNDLFSPSRGVIDAPPKKTAAAMPKRSQLELIGIWTMGLLKGAIIVSPISRTKTNKKKQSYIIGETIGTTAYKLVGINPDTKSAIVGIGNSEFEIKLERNDKGSLRRRNKGAADSKAMISISGPPKPPTPIVKRRPTKRIPVRASTKGRKTHAELKKIRQNILKKIMLQRKKRK